jgi:cardiolipin synthase
MNSPNRERIINIPNLLSISRIILIPVFLYMILDRNYIGALIVFFIAASTDMLDGMAARLLNQKTKLGVVLDPASDKALILAVYTILSISSIDLLNTIPSWLTIAVISRDLYIVTGAFILFKLIGQKSFSPTSLGKYCTFLQMGALLFVLLFNALASKPGFLIWLYLLTLILTVLSGLQYTYIGITWFKEYKR